MLGVRHTEIQSVAAAFRTIHASAFRAVAIVQKFGWATVEFCVTFGAELKFRHCGTVLTKVNHECLAGLQRYLLTFAELLGYYNLAESIIALSGDTFPDICTLRGESQVVAQIYFRTVREGI